MRTAPLMVLLLLLSAGFVRQGLAVSPMPGIVHTTPPPLFAPDRVLVHFKPGTAASEVGKAHRQAGAQTLKVIPGIDVQVVGIPQGTVLKTLARYRANPNVVYAEPDYYRVLVIPDEENYSPLFGGPDRDYFEEQWGLNNTGQPLTDPIHYSPTDRYTGERCGYRCTGRLGHHDRRCGGKNRHPGYRHRLQQH